MKKGYEEISTRGIQTYKCISKLYQQLTQTFLNIVLLSKSSYLEFILVSLEFIEFALTVLLLCHVMAH